MPVRQKRPVRVLVVENEALAAYFTSYLGRVWRRANARNRGFSYQVHNRSDPEDAYNLLSLRRFDIIIGRWNYADSNCPPFTMYQFALESAGDDPQAWPHVYILDVLTNELMADLHRQFASYIARGAMIHWLHKEDPATPPKVSQELAHSLARALEMHTELVT